MAPDLTSGQCYSAWNSAMSTSQARVCPARQPRQTKDVKRLSVRWMEQDVSALISFIINN